MTLWIRRALWCLGLPFYIVFAPITVLVGTLSVVYIWVVDGEWDWSDTADLLASHWPQRTKK